MVSSGCLRSTQPRQVRGELRIRHANHIGSGDLDAVPRPQTNNREGHHEPVVAGRVSRAASGAATTHHEAIRALVGYDFLYWSSAMRPGEQIDRTVDLSFVPNAPAGLTATGQNRPMPPLKSTGYWAQGLHLGLELVW